MSLGGTWRTGLRTGRHLGRVPAGWAASSQSQTKQGPASGRLPVAAVLGVSTLVVAPCFVEDRGDKTVRTDTVVLACTHFPLLLERLAALAPWPVNWIDPAPAIARRVADLLGAGSEGAGRAAAKVIFTSGRSHALPQSLAPFFGGKLPA